MCVGGSNGGALLNLLLRDARSVGAVAGFAVRHKVVTVVGGVDNCLLLIALDLISVLTPLVWQSFLQCTSLCPLPMSFFLWKLVE